MHKNNELINILKAQLTILSKDILQNIHQKDIKDLYKSTRQLYEKMAAVMLLKDNISTEELKKMITDTVVSEPDSESKAEVITQDKKQKISAKPVKNMSIGLNDRISFIKHLFKGDADAYNHFVDTLNAFETYEKALQYIHNSIKPQFDNWDGLDEYEFRLLQLLELKFA